MNPEELRRKIDALEGKVISAFILSALVALGIITVIIKYDNNHERRLDEIEARLGIDAQDPSDEK